MTELLSAAELKDRASLVELLNRLGHNPARKSGKEHMYRSMIREDDNTPSFCVDDKIGTWYDHGIGKGGNIIDFGLKYWPDLKFKEVVAKINEVLNGVISSESKRSNMRQRKATKVPHFIVSEIKPLGTHPAVTNYLKNRGVFEAGRNLLSEVYYYAKGAKSTKIFFAAGWRNENGSWEVRNRYFKSCIGLKAISFIERDLKKLAVFEGFMDYLTWQIDNPADQHSVLVLNSLAMLEAAIPKARQFSRIDVYFDRDAAGLKTTKELMAQLPYAVDRSEVYQGFKDYNAMLVAFIRQADAIEREELSTKNYAAQNQSPDLQR